MNASGCEGDLLGQLSLMPFLDRLEMAAMTGWSRGAVYAAVRTLEEGGLVAPVPHATELTAPTARFCVTAAGLGRLAGELGVAEADLLCARPVSAQWRRILLARLDAVASVYRLASAISAVSRPVALRWYRAMPMDASVELADGRVVYVVRQGRTPDRTGMARRMWRLWDEPHPGLLLALVPDEVRRRRMLTLMTDGPVPALAALERAAVAAGPRDRVWRAPSGRSALDLEAVLDRALPGGRAAVETRRVRAAPPGDLAEVPPGGDLPDHMLPAILGTAEKRALDLLFDWPWISRGDLAGLLGVSDSRASRIVASLGEFGLAVRMRGAQRRLALTDRGLAVLARRDRTSVGVARRRWSAAPVDSGRAYVWRNVSGARSRQLLRNLGHTAAVHGFIAAMSRQAWSCGWRVEQLDPPAGASRYFRLGDRLRSVNPDAFGVLTRGGVTWPFMLEWERRAVRPATMAERLAPYLRYFSTHRPMDDHGVNPTVLVVFDDELAAVRFLRVARRELDRTGVELPLMVSDMGTVNRLGPLGPAWRRVGEWSTCHSLPAA